MIRKALKNYKHVVFLDSDATFVGPQVPLEWLFDQWNINEDTMTAMAEDPDIRKNHDDRGNVLWNTGFIIAQRSERALQLLRDWEHCPTENKFSGCKH